MAWYYVPHLGEPVYVSIGDPRFNRDVIFYHDPAPVSFRTPPFYNFVDYCRPFRDQHHDFSHGGEFNPVRDPVHVRREDPYTVYPYPYLAAPWWPNRDYPPYDRYPVWIAEHPHGEDSCLEFYAPQLYSYCRKRKVLRALKAFPGVVNVIANQRERKVVVVGNGLREEQVLRRLQLVPHVERSVFWRDRRC